MHLPMQLHHPASKFIAISLMLKFIEMMFNFLKESINVYAFCIQNTCYAQFYHRFNILNVQLQTVQIYDLLNQIDKIEI